MPHDHIPAADILQHGGRHFAGEGADRLPRTSDCAPSAMLDDFSNRADFPQVDERRAHGDIGRRLTGQAQQQTLR